MNKVVYNAQYGGFELSEKAQQWMLDHGFKPEDGDNDWIYGEELPRHLPLLVKCVETLGKSASGQFSNLQIAVIEGNKYFIDYYDGLESVETPENHEWVTIEESK